MEKELLLNNNMKPTSNNIGQASVDALNKGQKDGDVEPGRDYAKDWEDAVKAD